MKVAVLDDYQGVALSFTDWTPVTSQAEVVTFPDHVDDESILAERLRDVAILVLMRERTPVTSSLLASLPALRLIVTTGQSNAVSGCRRGTERVGSSCAAQAATRSRRSNSPGR